MIEDQSDQAEAYCAPVVEGRGIGRRSPGTTDWLLQDVSLSIDGGDRIALAGPSGAGKTLLLRALATLDPVDTGNIFWRGESLTPATVPVYRSRVIYLQQRPALGPGTVVENLKWPFTLRVFGDRRFDKERITRMLGAVGRETAFLAKSYRDLSGGERQLVSLVRALQLDPTVLLLDEPTAALDSETRQAVEALIGQWQNETPRRRAVLWVTHDMEQATRVADRTLTMRDGRLMTEP